MECITPIARSCNGSDEKIVYCNLAERAMLTGIAKFIKFAHVSLQVFLKDVVAAQKITFLRTWTPPCTVFRLAAGPLVLINVICVVSDATLAVEDILIGLPVLQQFGH